MTHVSVDVCQQWRVPKGQGAAVLCRKALAAGAGLGLAEVHFVASESLAGSKVSPVARVLKKYPQFESLAGDFQPVGSAIKVRAISSDDQPGPPAVSNDLLLAVLDGVPRSYPFERVQVKLVWPGPELVVVYIGDDWWVNGRMRSLMVTWRGQADAASKVAPEPSPELAELLAAFGKPKKTLRQPSQDAVASVPSELIAIVRRYREGLGARVAALTLPHELVSGVGESAGPMKPLLVETFGPLGFECRGGVGTFSLRRRTAANHIVELSLDVGTWSHLFTGFLIVHVPGARLSLQLLVATTTGQVPIEGAQGWIRIVENLRVVVEDLENSFVAEIEAAAESAPTWFEAE